MSSRDSPAAYSVPNRPSGGLSSPALGSRGTPTADRGSPAPPQRVTSPTYLPASVSVRREDMRVSPPRRGASPVVHGTTTAASGAPTPRGGGTPYSSHYLSSSHYRDANATPGATAGSGRHTPAGTQRSMPTAEAQSLAANAAKDGKSTAVMEELANTKRAVQHLEQDKVHQIRELSAMKLDEEAKRVAMAQQHQSERALERERTALAMKEVEAEGKRQAAAERKRADDALGRLQQAENEVVKAHRQLSDKETEIQRLAQQNSHTEAAATAKENELNATIRGLHGKIEALTAMAEARARDVDEERQKTLAAATKVDAMREFVQDLNDKIAAMESRMGELQVANDDIRAERDAARRNLDQTKAQLAADVDRTAQDREVNAEVVSRLEREITQLKAEVRGKNKTIGEYEVRSAEQLEVKTTLERDMYRLDTDKQAVERQLREASLAVANAKDAASAVEARLAETSVELQATKNKHSSAQAEVDRLRKDLAREQAHAADTNQRNDELQMQLRKLHFLEEQVRSQELAKERALSDADVAEKRALESSATVSRLEVEVNESRRYLMRVRDLENELAGLQERLAQATSRADQHRMALEECRRERDGVQGRLAAAESRINDMTSDREALLDQLKDLEQDSARASLLEGKVATLEETLNYRTRELSEAIQEAGELKQVQLQMEAELKDIPSLHVALEHARQEQAKLLDMRERLEQDLYDAQQAADELRRTMRKMEAEAAQQKDEVAAVERHFDDAREQLRSQAQKLEDMRRLEIELGRLQADLRASETNLESAKFDKNALGQRIEALTGQIDDGRASNKTLQHTIEELQVELGRRMVSCETAERSAAKANARLEGIAAERDDAHKALHKAEKAIEHRDATIHALQREAQQAADAKAVAAQEFADLDRAHMELRHVFATTEERNAALAKELGEVKAAFTNSTLLQGKIAGLERILNERSAEIDALNATIKEKNEHIRSSETAVLAAQRTEQRAVEVRAEVRRLADELQQQEDANAAASKQHVELKSQLRAARDACADVDAELSRTKDRLASTNEYVAKLEADLQRKANAEGTASGLKSVVEDREREISDLRQRISTMDDAIDSKDEELRRLRRIGDEQAELDKRLVERGAVVSELEAEARRHVEQIAQLQADAANAAQSQRIAEEAADTARRTRDEFALEITSLREKLDAEVHAHEEDSRSNVMELNKLHALCADQRDENAELADKARRLAANVESLEQSLNTANGKIRALEQEAGNRTVEIDVVRAAHDEHKMTAQQLTLSLADEKRQLRDAEHARAEAEATLASLRAVLDDERAKKADDLDRLEAALANLKADIQQRSVIISEKDDMISRLNRDAFEANEAHKARADECRRLSLDLSGLQTQLAEMRTTVQEAADRRTSAELSSTELEIALSQKASQVQTLERQLARETTRRQDAERQLQTTTASLTASMTATEDARMAELQQRVDTLFDENSRLRSTLADSEIRNLSHTGGAAGDRRDASVVSPQPPNRAVLSPRRGDDGRGVREETLRYEVESLKRENAGLETRLRDAQHESARRNH